MVMTPIHPALVHFPIALMALAFIAEAVGYLRDSHSARAAGAWAIAGAAVGGVLTVAAGYWDMGRASLSVESQAMVQLHMKMGWVVFAGIGFMALWRGALRRKLDAPGLGYLSAALLMMALTFFQAWFGGEIAHAHGAGMAAANQGMRPREQAKEESRVAAEFLRRIPLMDCVWEPADGAKEKQLSIPR